MGGVRAFEPPNAQESSDSDQTLVRPGLLAMDVVHICRGQGRKTNFPFAPDVSLEQFLGGGIPWLAMGELVEDDV